ncbi:MAG TPA: M23 family metallopeptidase, partial [Candidatus Dormibacteraeota bacterium]|nr:M23 family metallopeptidase [Candidatus Dormibacteraeota bacterium]
MGSLAVTSTAFVTVLATFASNVADSHCAPSDCATVAAFAAPITCARMWVSQGFGETRFEHPHRGIDIVCPPGTPVRAVAPGLFRRRSDLS